MVGVLLSNLEVLRKEKLLSGYIMQKKLYPIIKSLESVKIYQKDDERNYNMDIY